MNYNFGSIHSDEQDPVADNSLLRSAGHSAASSALSDLNAASSAFGDINATSSGVQGAHRAAMEDANGTVLQETRGSVLQDVTNSQQISQPPGSNIYQGLSQVSIYLFIIHLRLI